jgi:hypothetical protein
MSEDGGRSSAGSPLHPLRDDDDTRDALRDATSKPSASMTFIVYGYEPPASYTSYFPNDVEITFESEVNAGGGRYIILRDANSFELLRTYGLESMAHYDVVSDDSEDMDLLSITIRGLGRFLFECDDGQLLYNKITAFVAEYGTKANEGYEGDEGEGTEGQPGGPPRKKRVVAGMVKNLMVPLFVICMYLTVSFVYYGHLSIEGWEFIDSWYYGMVTMSTVGYGDLTPQTNGSKIFTCFYILFGIAAVANAVKNLAHWVIEKRAELQDNFMATARTQMKTTIHGKKVSVTRGAETEKATGKHWYSFIYGTKVMIQPASSTGHDTHLTACLFARSAIPGNAQTYTQRSGVLSGGRKDGGAHCCGSGHRCCCHAGPGGMEHFGLVLLHCDYGHDRCAHSHFPCLALHTFACTSAQALVHK